MVKVVVLVPNYNGRRYLADCLEALRRQTFQAVKIILIDDGSIDDSISYVNNYFPEVEILKLEKNVGFAQAVNSGIRYALNKYHPEYLAILNNDTKADVNWLDSLVKTADSDVKAVAVSSNMLYFDRPNVINSQGGTCDLIGYAQDINAGKKLEVGYQKPTRVLSACWGAALIRVSVIEKIGLLDERYFSFAEDVDWGWRANLLGYKVVSDPKAIVLHHGSASWKGRDIKRHELCFRNMFCTMLKNYSTPKLFILLVIILLHYPLVSIGYLLNLKFKGGRLTKVFNHKNNWQSRLRSSLIPWKSLVWNMKELKATLGLRKVIQNQRKILDKEISKLMVL